MTPKPIFGTWNVWVLHRRPRLYLSACLWRAWVLCEFSVLGKTSATLTIISPTFVILSRILKNPPPWPHHSMLMSFSPSHNQPFSFILTSHNIQTSSYQDWLNRLVDPIMTSLRSLVCLTYLCCLSREEVESKNRRAKSMRSGWCKEQTWMYMFPNGENI